MASMGGSDGVVVRHDGLNTVWRWSFFIDGHVASGEVGRCAGVDFDSWWAGTIRIVFTTRQER